MLDASHEPAQPQPALPRIEIATKPLVTRRSAPPPLGIDHLMLWVACCALYMAFMRRMIMVEPGALGLSILAAYGLAASLSWAGLAILVTRQLCGRLWPIHTGEWLLATVGLQFALQAAAELLVGRLPGFPYHLIDALICCFLVMPLLGKLPRRWSIVFGALVILTAWPPLAVVLTNHEWTAMPPWFLLARSAAMIMLVLPAAAIDLRRGERYGWLHWLGLGVFCYDQLMVIAFVLLVA
jgi:hypothetical protein